MKFFHGLLQNVDRGRKLYYRFQHIMYCIATLNVPQLLAEMCYKNTPKISVYIFTHNLKSYETIVICLYL